MPKKIKIFTTGGSLDKGYSTRASTFVVQEPQGKTIVLTGAMQPASFKKTDAYFNIGFAIATLQILPHGVYLAINGRIFNPLRVTKNIVLDRFEEEI